MKERINPEMIVLARESRGYTQGALAKAISVNRTTILRYESGLLEVPPDRLSVIAAFLHYPETFFYLQERLYNTSCMHHRKRKSLSVRELKRIHAQVNILRIRATRLLREAEIESENRFHRLAAQEYGGPEKTAQMLRYLWQMPTGPVRNVVDAIEAAGGIVFRCPFETSKVDAISQWPLDAPELPPVFFVNRDVPGDRERWTLCHEIGHIVMHHVPTADPEGEADRFASEFLMPAEEISTELRDMTLQKAASLKARWKTSMGALIRRAYDLNRITERQYRYLNAQLSARGYRKCEPVPIPPEEPEVFQEIIELHRHAHGRDTQQLSSLVGMFEEDFRAEYWQGLGGLRLVI